MRFTDEDINDPEVMEFLAEQESQWMESPVGVLDRVKKLLLIGDQQSGATLPWNKTHESFRMRPGELTCWAGTNGHGKSQMLGQVMAWLLPTQRVCIASMEMTLEKTILRLLRQCSGQENPTVDFAERWSHWADDRLYLYDQLDNVETTRIIAMINYAAVKLKCEHIVIDSMMKCGVTSEKNDPQKEFVNTLTSLAKMRNIHIHLVHHVRKGTSEYDMPNKYDVKGAGEIVDQVDNLCIVFRNKRKEEDIRNGEDVDAHVPDAWLKIDKQRHGEREDKFSLFFHTPSQQYTPKHGYGAMPWPYPGATILDHTVTTSQENSGRPLGENPAGVSEFPETGFH